ncbi:MAG: glycerol-3-phosphate dehydrogenase/oxidase [Saprospiraceae bacterium]|nr:glycerol-3-phosphate dehydrogenase/oxidase [Saprospiraceae bacterium]
MTRKERLNTTCSDTFDLVIIGGGITGAGVLLEASKKGYKTLLIEKGDFSSGTSSKSAKLVHGGLRYLQFFYFKLVRESLVERNYLLETYPHIVKPLEFIFPLYQSSFKFRMAMILYQMMGRHDIMPNYSFANKEKTLHKLNAVNSENLKGSFSYYDGITNDSRLTTEIILEAKEYTNAAALNYFELINSKQSDSHYTLNCLDHLNNNHVEIKTRYVVNCGGPWTDKILDCLVPESEHSMAPSKGIHLVFSQNRIPMKSAYAFSSYANDKRMFYALPWEHNSVIIGVTDTEYNGDPDNIEVNQNDINYVLHGINRFLPDLNVTEDDILYEFAGLRPLFKEKTASQDKTRDFKIWWNNNRVISLAGGKLTTFRAMAKALTLKLKDKLEIKPAEKIGHSNINKTIPDSVSPEKIKHIKNKYGNKDIYLFNLIHQNPELGNWLDEEFQILNVEIAFFIKHQDSFYVDDILNRRLALGYILNKHPKNKIIKEKVRQILEQYKELVNNER